MVRVDDGSGGGGRSDTGPIADLCLASATAEVLRLLLRALMTSISNFKTFHIYSSCCASIPIESLPPNVKLTLSPPPED